MKITLDLDDKEIEALQIAVEEWLDQVFATRGDNYIIPARSLFDKVNDATQD
jgi:hypothetical protein